MTIPEIVEQLQRSHRICPPASDAALAHGRSLGLPGDVLEFYRLSNGVYLHRTDWSGGTEWKWKVLPIEGLRDVPAVYDVGRTCPLFATLRHWIAIVDVLDSNYLAVDVAPERCGQIVDCFHETSGWEGYHDVIA